MAQGTLTDEAVPKRPVSAAVESPAAVPWYLWCGVLAVTSMEIGGIWDLSWHRSIGRDTFWTPAHMAVQAGGIIAAIVCGFLVAANTFSRSHRNRAAAVEVFGLRAPLGAFVSAWGGITMVSSVPFDNWWHAAYGLDTRIISPPHALLLLGVLCVEVGMLILALAAMNRAEQAHRSDYKSLERVFFYIGGVLTASFMFCAVQYINNTYLHASRPYKAIGVVGAVGITLIAQAHPHRWAATIVSSIYMAVMIASILILPLFPATPKLGPVFFPVTHMVPSSFPALLIVPAIGLDLLWRRTRAWKAAPLALLSGLVFMLLLVAAEWPSADFLLSPWAANRFFGTMYHEYTALPSSTLSSFLVLDSGWRFVRGMMEAVLFSMIGAWIGIYLGRWMRSVRR